MSSGELEGDKLDHEISSPKVAEFYNCGSPTAVEVNYNSESSLGEKRKQESQVGGSSSKKQRSRVWDHFTKVFKEDGQSDKCQCNHCHKLFSCSSRSGTTHLLRHIADGICHTHKKQKDLTVTISSNDPTPLTWENTVHANPKVPENSVPKYQHHNGEASLMDEDFGGSFASKVVELMIERMGSFTALASAKSGPDYSISAAVKCLNEYDDIPQSSEMYLDAVEILEDAGERECFLCLPREPRRRWLQRVLHRRHPLRYSSKM